MRTQVRRPMRTAPMRGGNRYIGMATGLEQVPMRDLAMGAPGKAHTGQRQVRAAEPVPVWVWVWVWLILWSGDYRAEGEVLGWTKDQVWVRHIDPIGHTPDGDGSAQALPDEHHDGPVWARHADDAPQRRGCHGRRPGRRCPTHRVAASVSQPVDSTAPAIRGLPQARVRSGPRRSLHSGRRSIAATLVPHRWLPAERELRVHPDREFQRQRLRSIFRDAGTCTGGDNRTAEEPL